MAECPHCRAPNPDGNTFCGACGKRVTGAPAEPPVPARSPDPGAARASSTAEPPARDRRVLRKVVALLVGAVVVGGVGLGLPALEALLPAGQSDVPEIVPARSEWHTQRAGEVPPLDARVVRVTPADLTQEPERFAERLVGVSGAVRGIVEEDGETLLSIVSEEQVITGLYQGVRSDVAVNDEVSVVGVVSPTGDEMWVLAISPTPGAVSDEALALAWYTLAVSGAFFAGAVFIRVRGGIDRRRRFRAGALCVVLTTGMLALLLSGCEVGVTTSVGTDGSGSVVTEIDVGQEQMDEILGLPNAQQFIDSWIADLGNRGVTVARGGTTLRMTRSFETVGEFNSAPMRSEENWTYLQAIEMPDGLHYVYAAAIDTSALQAEQGFYDEDGQVYEELDSRMQDAVFTYAVVLPGSPLGSYGGEPSWTVGMGETGRLFAESVIPRSTSTRRLGPGLLSIWETLLPWAAGIAAGLFAYALVAYPWRARRTR